MKNIDADKFTLLGSRRRAFITTLFATLLPGCVRRSVDVRVADPGLPQPHVRVQQPNGTIKTISLDYYVRGTILAEVPLASLLPRAAQTIAEVQSIIARTYVSIIEAVTPTKALTSAQQRTAKPIEIPLPT